MSTRRKRRRPAAWNGPGSLTSMSAGARTARRPTTPARVRVAEDGRVLERPDRLVTEEPMEIRLHGPGQAPAPVAVTMRTPGHDFELAVGFVLSERVVARADDIETVAYCLADDGQPQEYNVVTVRSRVPVDVSSSRRNFVANASCGLCGKLALDQVVTTHEPVGAGPRLARSTVSGLPDRLRATQSIFDVTGGLHAAACFDATGRLTAAREDVGRHNALDKLIGWAALAGRLPLADQVLLVSGRVSFEIVQKAAAAGLPVVCAVSAPSSLAVEAADRLGQTVVGFVRDGRCNVYTHPQRIDFEA